MEEEIRKYKVGDKITQSYRYGSMFTSGDFIIEEYEGNLGIWLPDINLYTDGKHVDKAEFRTVETIDELDSYRHAPRNTSPTGNVKLDGLQPGEKTVWEKDEKGEDFAYLKHFDNSISKVRKVVFNTDGMRAGLRAWFEDMKDE